jgi:hypothetical protein
MNDSEKVFADGFLFKRNESAPDFIVGNLSMDAKKAIEFINAHEKNGWVNLKIKKSVSSKYYLELDTWVPQNGQMGARKLTLEDLI